MIDIKLIREEPQKFKEAARAKNFHVDIDELLKIDVDGAFERDANDAERRASKRKWVRRPARDQADAEAADQRVDAIRHGDDGADDLVGHDVVCSLRPVVVANRVGNRGVHALA